MDSLPLVWAPHMAKAHEYGFNLTFVKSEKKSSHFSTLKTTQKYVQLISIACIWVIKLMATAT